MVAFVAPETLEAIQSRATAQGKSKGHFLDGLFRDVPMAERADPPDMNAVAKMGRHQLIKHPTLGKMCEKCHWLERKCLASPECQGFVE